MKRNKVYKLRQEVFMSNMTDKERGRIQVSARFDLKDYEQLRRLARLHGRSLSMECVQHTLASMRKHAIRREQPRERETAASR